MAAAAAAASTFEPPRKAARPKSRRRQISKVCGQGLFAPRGGGGNKGEGIRQELQHSKYCLRGREGEGTVCLQPRGEKKTLRITSETFVSCGASYKKKLIFIFDGMFGEYPPRHFLAANTVGEKQGPLAIRGKGEIS